MKKERKDKDFVKSPYFEGGRTAMDAYVKKEMKYPKEALAHKIEGSVSLQYVVDYKGKVIEAKVISGIGYGCDEEAIRIVRSLPFKVPPKGKIKSKYSRKIHIHFRLPGSAENGKQQVTPAAPKPSPSQQPSGVRVQYQITPQKKDVPTQGSKRTTSYQFNITLPSRPSKK